MRYKPDYIPNDADARTLVEYLNRELNKIAETVDHPETTTVNYGKEVQNTASGSTVTINWKRGQKQRLTLSASTTVTFVPPEGVCNLMLVLAYGGVYTPTLPSTVYWAGGTDPTWTKISGRYDVIAMYYDGTKYHASVSLDSK